MSSLKACIARESAQEPVPSFAFLFDAESDVAHWHDAWKLAARRTGWGDPTTFYILKNGAVVKSENGPESGDSVRNVYAAFNDVNPDILIYDAEAAGSLSAGARTDRPNPVSILSRNRLGIFLFDISRYLSGELAEQAEYDLQTLPLNGELSSVHDRQRLYGASFALGIRAKERNPFIIDTVIDALLGNEDSLLTAQQYAHGTPTFMTWKSYQAARLPSLQSR
jgi:hypothetical protein